MTVTELINKLSKFPGETDVLVNGYETGFDHIKTVCLQNVKRRQDSDWFNGEFDEIDKTTDNARQTVVIWRPFKND
jgi:hypothetical protein